MGSRALVLDYFFLKDHIMTSNEDDKIAGLILFVLGMFLCGIAVGTFFGQSFGFLFVGLPLLTLGIYGLIKGSK